MDRVLVCCDDLFFRVHIEARIREARLMPLPVIRLAELEPALAPEEGPPPHLRAAVVDLQTRSGDALAILMRLAEKFPGLPMLAFGVEPAAMEAARRAGAAAIPRSHFGRDFGEFISKVAVGVSPTAPSAPPEGEEISDE